MGRVSSRAMGLSVEICKGSLYRGIEFSGGDVGDRWLDRERRVSLRAVGTGVVVSKGRSLENVEFGSCDAVKGWLGEVVDTYVSNSLAMDGTVGVAKEFAGVDRGSMEMSLPETDTCSIETKVVIGGANIVVKIYIGRSGVVLLAEAMLEAVLKIVRAKTSVCNIIMFCFEFV